MPAYTPQSLRALQAQIDGVTASTGDRVPGEAVLRGLPDALLHAERSTTKSNMAGFR